MTHFSRSMLGMAITAILATPTVTWAQSADATLRGKAPASTAVTAKNVATGATRRTQASAEGIYTLAGLPPGTYRVDAGPGTARRVRANGFEVVTQRGGIDERANQPDQRMIPSPYAGSA